MPTVSDLSIDYLNKASSMVAGNEKTIKLIYAIQDINLMLVFNMSGGCTNGHDRTFSGSDREHDTGEFLANGNTLRGIELNRNSMVAGEMQTHWDVAKLLEIVLDEAQNGHT